MADKSLTFCIGVFGDSYTHYLYALLQSIDDIYQGGADISVAYMDMAPAVLEEISHKLSYAKLVPFAGPARVDNPEEPISYTLYMWEQQLEDAETTNVVFPDTDMLLVKPVDCFFDDNQFDIGYTYKTEWDENLQCPINSGMILARRSSRTMYFFREWSRITQAILAAQDYKSQWGGGQQDAFVYLLDTHEVRDWRNGCMRCGCQMQGFTCRQLNDVRRYPVVGKDTHAIHYKGAWKDVLPHGVWDGRVVQWRGRHAYNLWRRAYERWLSR